MTSQFLYKAIDIREHNISNYPLNKVQEPAFLSGYSQIKKVVIPLMLESRITSHNEAMNTRDEKNKKRLSNEKSSN
ncbi:hypothetical protein [Nostoc sp.]|uniref:hypothetical protein n=1 Tax=Nostoc sp. TaxID=1180 RepID=UPI002FFB6FB5